MIVAAHLEHGYTLAEIGRQTGLHYTTISKIITGAGVFEPDNSRAEP